MLGFCSRCAQARTSKNRYCKKCHAENMREWRKTHFISEDQRLKTIARSKLNVNLKRGKVEKYPCIQCGEINVEAHHWDYSRPLDVIWLCRKHHEEVHALLLKQAQG